MPTGVLLAGKKTKKCGLSVILILFVAAASRADGSQRGPLLAGDDTERQD